MTTMRSWTDVNYQSMKEPLRKLKSQLCALIGTWFDSEPRANAKQDLKNAWRDVVFLSESSTEFSNNLVKSVVHLIDLIQEGLETGGPVEFYKQIKSQIKESKDSKVNEKIQKLIDAGNYLGYIAIIDDTSYKLAMALVHFINEILDKNSSFHPLFIRIQTVINRLEGASEKNNIVSILIGLRNILAKNIEYYTETKPRDLYESRISSVRGEKFRDYYIKLNLYKDELIKLKNELERRKIKYDSMSLYEQNDSIEHEKSSRIDIINKMQNKMKKFQTVLDHNRDEKFFEFDWVKTTIDHIKYMPGLHAYDIFFDVYPRGSDLNPESHFALSIALSPGEFKAFDSIKMGDYNEIFIRVAGDGVDELHHIRLTAKKELVKQCIFPGLTQQSDWLPKYDCIVKSSRTIQVLSVEQNDALYSQLGLQSYFYWKLAEWANIFETNREYHLRQLNDFYMEEEHNVQKFDDDLSEKIKQYKEEVSAMNSIETARNEYKDALIKKDQIEMKIKGIIEKQGRVRQKMEKLAGLIPGKEVEERLNYNNYRLKTFINKLNSNTSVNISVKYIISEDELMQMLDCSSEQKTLVNDVYKKVNSPIWGESTLPLNELLLKIKPIVEEKLVNIDKEIKKIHSKMIKLEKFKSKEKKLENELEHTQIILMKSKTELERKLENIYIVNKNKMYASKIIKSMGFYVKKNKDILFAEQDECRKIIEQCNSPMIDMVPLIIKIRSKIKAIDSNTMLSDRIGDSSENKECKKSIQSMKKNMECFVEFHEIHRLYFNNINGKIYSDTSGTFLEKAKKQICESLIVLFFGCFGYQSETTFIKILEQTSLRCQQNLFVSESRDTLKQLIDDRARDYGLSKELSDYKQKLESFYFTSSLPEQKSSQIEVGPNL